MIMEHTMLLLRFHLENEKQIDVKEREIFWFVLDTFFE